MPLNRNSKIRTCEMQKGVQRLKFFWASPLASIPGQNSIVSKIIANFSCQCASCTCRMKRWALMPWNLGDYVEKMLKITKKQPKN